MRWGVLGTGEIARTFVADLARSAPTERAVAVASRDIDRAAAFAAEHGIPRSHGSYDALLADSGVDVVYIATVHTEHAQWSVRAAEAGKHVLTEKPGGVNVGETMTAFEAARRAGIAYREGYMYRHHPRTARVLQLVADGTLGRVQHISATYSFRSRASAGRLFDPTLAGGGILDVGGYPASFALAIARAAGVEPTDPISVTGTGTVTADGVDTWATADLVFPGGITAHLECGVSLAVAPVLRIVGSAGVLTVDDPWRSGPDARDVIALNLFGEEPRTIESPGVAPYATEATAMAEAAASGWSEMEARQTLALSRILDRWRQAVGGSYEWERSGVTPPRLARPTAARKSMMRYGRIDGVDKDISRLVMGCDNQRDIRFAAAMWDDFVEAGGNAFDTAYEYSGRLQEKLLGQWMADRGVRDDMVVIGKGAHTPYCDPQSLESQLLETLDDLRTDHLDVYFMHRDNPDVPVGEFVDVLDRYYQAGTVRAFGGSNWTRRRFEAANAYAAREGKQGFTALSNHFGLAEAIALPWAGTEHVTDAASKNWLQQTGIPLFPWASQARGFFARARPDDRSDPQLVRGYYSDGNFERLRRASVIAAEYGATPTAVALAFVLAQRFPTFPIIGPRSTLETHSSLDALRIPLTSADADWLDLTTDIREA